MRRGQSKAKASGAEGVVGPRSHCATGAYDGSDQFTDARGTGACLALTSSLYHGAEAMERKARVRPSGKAGLVGRTQRITVVVPASLDTITPMEPTITGFPFVDAAGRAWLVVDYRIVAWKKKRVPISDWRAEGRAFVPDGWEGPVMLHEFGRTPYRETDARTLEANLKFAKPSTATAAERMQRNV